MNLVAGCGAIVREQRSLKGWTQEDLAEHARVGVRTIQRLESRNQGSAVTLQRVSAALGVEAEAVLTAARIASSQVGIGFMPRIQTGHDLLAIVGGADAFELAHAQPNSEDKVALIGDFAQRMQDLGDVWGMMDSGARARESFELQAELDALEASRFLVFAIREKRKCTFGVGESRQSLLLTAALVGVQRAGHPAIITLQAGVAS